jgi:hypothetical protein
MAEFKRRAARTINPEDMWAIQGYLAHAQRQIDTKYDYRYSQLVFVFGRLLRENRISLQDLHGLAAENGACQSSCRLPHATRRSKDRLANSPATTESRSGFSVTTSIGFQFRVC